MKLTITFTLLILSFLILPIVSYGQTSTLFYGNGFQFEDVEIEGNFNVGTLDNIIEAQFSTDGTKYYTVSFPNIVMQHTLTTPYDITSITGSETSFVNSIFDEIRGIHLSPNGKKLFISGDNQFFGSTYGSNVVQYDLPTPFDITTGTTETFFEWRYPFIPCYCEISEISFSYDGLTMYAVVDISGTRAIRIYQFALNNPFDLDGLTVDYSTSAGGFINRSSLEWTGPDIESIEGFTFDPTGKFFFVLVQVNSIPNQSRVLRWRANTAFDILSLSGPPKIYITNERNAEFFDAMSFNFNGTQLFLGRLATNPVRVLNLNDSNNFKEVTANNGAVEGQQKIRIAGDAKFSNPGGTLFYNTDYQITNLPPGLIPDLAVSSDGITGTLTFSGNAANSQAINSIDNLSFIFFNSAFTNVVNSGSVNNSTTSNSGISITFNNRAPDARCKNITVQLDASGNVSITPMDVNDNSTAEGGIASMSINDDSFSCSDLFGFIETVTLTVTDNLGLTGSCTANVLVRDNIDPTAVCKDITIQLDNNGNATITGADINDGSTDNCEVTSLTASPNTFDCSNLGANTVTLTARDRSGNTSTCTATVTVETNTLLPTAICQNITVQLDNSGTVTIVGTDIDNGSIVNQCIDPPTFAVIPDTFDCSNIGENPVTFTLTDGDGQTSSCMAIVSVEDNTTPELTCRNITVQLDATGNVSIIPADIFVSSLNACGINGLTLDTNTFDCSSIGENTVVLTATGTNGNTSSCSAIVTVEDVISPTAVCQDITVQLDNTGTGTFDPSNLDGGSIDNCEIRTYHLLPTETITQSNRPDTNGITGIGQSFTSNTTGFLSKISVLADENYENLDVLFYEGANGSGISGDPGTPLYTESGVKLIDSENGVVWTDIYLSTPLPVVAGNSYSFVFPPSSTSSVTLYFGPDSYAEGTFLFLYANPLPNLDLAFEIDFFEIPKFDCDDIGNTNNFGLIVVDSQGNSSNCTANVTIVENTLPEAICQNVTVQLDASGSASITVADIDGGSSDNCGIASTSIDVSDFTCSNVGVNDVTLTVTDLNGNTSTCTAIVRVEDNIAPTVVCQDITVQLDTTGTISITAADVDGGSTDTCGIASLSVSPSSFDCTNVGANSVTLTVTDNNGNSSTCNATVTVEDNLTPTANCTAAFTLQLDVSGNASITVADIDNGSNDNCGIASTSIDITDFTCANLGANDVTLTVTDTNGNTSTCTTVVTVIEEINPVITCPATITIECDESTEPSNTGAATANDNCDTNPAITFSDVVVAGVGNNSTITRTWTATDASGNAASCDQIITVQDTIPPIAICQDITVQLDASGMASITASQIENGSNDNCGGVNLSIDMDTFDCSNTGLNTVTLTVTDVNGNASTCIATVTVEDTINPEITCPSSITENTGSAICGAIVTYTAPVGTDNCPNTITTQTDTTGLSSGDVFPVGTTTLEYTVTDASGNSAVCAFDVIIEDVEVPTPVCMDITVSLDENGMYVLDPLEVDNGSTDNCGIDQYVIFPDTFTCDDIGTNNVTLTVIDENGNGNICTATVTVVDTTPPTIACTADVTTSADAGVCSAVVNFPTAIALDNCDVTVTQTNGLPSGSSFPVGTTLIEFTATDAGGNSTVCTFNVIVTDDELPIAVCQDITVQLDEFGVASITAAHVDGGSTDNCGSVSSSISTSSFTCADVGANNVVLTVTDVNGNVNTCTAIVTVEDITAPLAVCQDITVALDADGMASIIPSAIDGGSSDACGIDTLTVDIDTFDCSNVGANTVTLTVTDVNGNSSTCTAVVTVEDTTAPTLVCQPATITIGPDGTATVDPLLLLDATYPLDNCTIDSLATNAGTLDCSDVGTTITITVFAVDASGNIASCETTLTIEDSEGPVFNQGTLPEDTDRDPGANGVYILEDFTVDVAASDNCSEPLLPIVIAQDPAPGTLLGVGVYDITLTAVDDLGNETAYVFELTVNPILEIEDTNYTSLSLYPNPTSDKVTLGNPNNLDLQEVAIYDLMGRSVNTINLMDMGTEKTIDVSLLQGATYILIIKSNQGQTVKQLIVE